MTNTTTTAARSSAPKWKGEPASEKQLALIAKLLDSKELNPAMDAALRDRLDEGVTKGDASAMIEWLFQAPRKQTAAESAPVGEPVAEAGIYERDGVAYKVQKSAAGRFYAKVLVINGAKRLTEVGEVISASYEYEAGAVNRISAADKVSPERARELGTLSSVCVVCGTKLEDAKSVERGIGPVCAKRI
jgi:hypothetical protein